MKFILSESAEKRIKKAEQFGIKDEGLKFLYEYVKVMYIEGSKAECEEIFIDPNTRENIDRARKRRSGKLACTHPYEVAYYLYRYNYPVEYIIAAFFHDVIEDTKIGNDNDSPSEYTLEDISKILDLYLKRYPPKVKDKWDIYPMDENGKLREPDIYTLIDDPEVFKEKVLDAIDKLSKKSHFSRPKEPKEPLSYILKIPGVRVLYRVTLNDIDRGYFWRQVDYPGDPLIIGTNTTIKDDEIDPDTGELKTPKVVKVYFEPSELDRPEEAEQKKRELQIYNGDMTEYINDVNLSDIARIVKIVDRIMNLTDFAPNVTSDWLEKYTREAVEFFLGCEIRGKSHLNGLISEDIPEPLKKHFEFALTISNKKRKSLKRNEWGDKGEIVVYEPPIYEEFDQR